MTKVSYEEKRATAEAVYWDLYRDAHGVRPRGIDTSNWTLNQFDAEFAQLEQIIRRNEAERAFAEFQAVTEFENGVRDEIQRDPSVTRESFIQSLHEKFQTYGDEEFLCYQLRLPYGYFKNV